jgi:D-alanyl-lipoteichoic acid acyltransferase DltB (MBOAT superfamily)
VLFTSPIFLLLFVPIVLAGYEFAQRSFGRNAAIAWLFASSLFFYAWWKPVFVLLLLASLFANYVALRLITAAPSVLATRAVVAAGVVFNLGLLGYFKYANFFLDNVGALVGQSWHIEGLVLPIGISFFTFQQVAMLVDVGAGRARMPKALDYVFFVSFFPQLIAGPIVRHDELIPQVGSGTRGLTQENLGVGITVFAVGLAKKMVVADSMAVHASPIFNAAAHGIPLDFVLSWYAALAYTLQIYFDFSGYSDMAVGLGRMFGFNLPINFASPYKARSIADFWRRWHITLSRFLRDYLYIPLGGNRYGENRRLVNLMITMGLGGIWHGAGWNFAIWGLLHGLYLVVERWWTGVSQTRNGGRGLPRGMARLLTLLCVVFAWVPFRAADLDATLSVWSAMVGLGGLADSPLDYKLKAVPIIMLVVFWGVSLAAPNTYQWMRRGRAGTGSHGYPATFIDAPDTHDDVRSGWSTWRPAPGFAVVAGCLLALSALRFFSLSEFIYFQF